MTVRDVRSLFLVIASEAKQSILEQSWIASSLRSSQ
jgi:hypothetical protein